MAVPSNTICPPLASCRNSTTSAVVVLPQPLSPTSARVSPRWSSKVTPSTARMDPLPRPPRLAWVEKRFCRS